VFISRGATPDPIPNSEVKSSCGDGIARATVWESSTMPAFILDPVSSLTGFFILGRCNRQFEIFAIFPDFVS
jgi:hypothetical protein